jgi:thioredoxin reductase (NADPH)
VTPTSRPTLLAVDDDAQVRAAVRRDLQARYARDYRVVVAGGGPEALEIVEELHRRDEEVALFLVDERMPDLTGTAFLLRAREHFPEARKVLLTAYADTDAAIRSINEVGLDHYLLKPWSPPEDHLYPVLDDLLDDWMAGRPAPFDGLRVVGARWSPTTHDLKEFLARNQVPYRSLDVDRDAEAATLLATLDEDAPLLPVVFLTDGQALVHPEPSALGEHIGLHATPSAPLYDLVVVGAGPAGLAGAVYGASEGLRVAVLERQATGGQAGTSARIENYLGFPNGVSGADLARRATAQARRLGAEILSPIEVATVEVGENTRTVHLTDGTAIAGRSLLVASGMKVRRLDAPGVERLTGAGVYYGATLADGTSYRGERVVVVGGANSAGQAAVMFSRFAEEVVILARSPSLDVGMSRYLIDQIEATPNVQVRTGVEVASVHGEEHLERVEVTDGEDVAAIDATGMFVFVGAVPYSDFLDGVVARSPRGFVLTGPDITGNGSRPRGWRPDRDPYLYECSVPGVFAAGDVRDGAVRRVAAAVGQGSTCISLVHQYLGSA